MSDPSPEEFAKNSERLKNIQAELNSPSEAAAYTILLLELILEELRAK